LADPACPGTRTPARARLPGPAPPSGPACL